MAFDKVLAAILAVVVIISTETQCAEPSVSLRSDTTIRNFFLLTSRDLGYTWQEGVERCKSYTNGRLAFLDDVTTADIVQRFLQTNKWFWGNGGKKENEMIWLGGRRNDTREGWTWVGGKPMEEEVISLSPGRCVARGLSDTEHVNMARPCSGLMGQFLCVLSTDKCEGHVTASDRVIYLPSGHCLVVCSSVAKEYSWFEARNYCLLQGGDLIQEQSADWTMYDHSGSMWVGANTRSWWWNGEKEIQYTRWNPRHPYDVIGPSCLAADVDGWEATPCGKRLSHIICEEQIPLTDINIAKAELPSDEIKGRARDKLTPDDSDVTPPIVTSCDDDNEHQKFRPSDALSLPVLSGFVAGVVLTTAIVIIVRMRKGSSVLKAANQSTTSPVTTSPKHVQRDYVMSPKRAEQNIYTIEPEYETIKPKL